MNHKRPAGCTSLNGVFQTGVEGEENSFENLLKMSFFTGALNQQNLYKVLIQNERKD